MHIEDLCVIPVKTLLHILWLSTVWKRQYLLRHGLVWHALQWRQECFTCSAVLTQLHELDVLLVDCFIAVVLGLGPPLNSLSCMSCC
jgi:hypothetical protein